MYTTLIAFFRLRHQHRRAGRSNFVLFSASSNSFCSPQSITGSFVSRVFVFPHVEARPTSSRSSFFWTFFFRALAELRAYLSIGAELVVRLFFFFFLTQSGELASRGPSPGRKPRERPSKCSWEVACCRHAMTMAPGAIFFSDDVDFRKSHDDAAFLSRAQDTTAVHA